MRRFLSLILCLSFCCISFAQRLHYGSDNVLAVDNFPKTTIKHKGHLFEPHEITMVNWPHEDPLDQVHVFMDLKCIDDMRAYSATELDGKENGNQKGTFFVLCSPDSRNAALDYYIQVDYSRPTKHRQSDSLRSRNYSSLITEVLQRILNETLAAVMSA